MSPSLKTPAGARKVPAGGGASPKVVHRAPVKDGDAPIHAGAKQGKGVLVIVREAGRPRPKPIGHHPTVGRRGGFVERAGHEGQKSRVAFHPRPVVVTDVAHLPVLRGVQDSRVPLGAQGSAGAIPNPAVAPINLRRVHEPLQPIQRRGAGKARVNDRSVGASSAAVVSVR